MLYVPNPLEVKSCGYNLLKIYIDFDKSVSEIKNRKNK